MDFRSVLLTFFLMTLIGAGSLTAGQNTVLLTTGEWDPYVSQHLTKKGMVAEIVALVFKEMKQDHQLKFYPWKRAELMVEKGKAFAAFPYLKTPERMKSYYFSDTIASSTGRFFFNKNNFKKVAYKDLNELSAYKVGGTLGFWYEAKLKAIFSNYEAVKSETSNVKKLMKGRVDLVPMDELGGYKLIKKLFPNQVNQFDTLDRPLNKSELYLMVSKSYPDAKKLLDQFNVALKKIKSNGSYRRVLKSYGIKE